MPDDSALRLVVLSPEHWYSRDEERQAADAVLEYVRNNGDQATSSRQSADLPGAGPGRADPTPRLPRAWRWRGRRIVDDVKEGRLNIDQLQKKQAEKELQTAEDVVPRAARECFKWLLCPVQDTPTEPKPTVEAFPLNTTGGSAGERARAGLPRERAGHHDVVADPPADRS